MFTCTMVCTSKRVDLEFKVLTLKLVSLSFFSNFGQLFFEAMKNVAQFVVFVEKSPTFETKN